MAFFKKLRERLFKSSSKIDEGLDAIVADGGEEEFENTEGDQLAQESAAEMARLQQEAELKAKADLEEARLEAEATAEEAQRQAVAQAAEEARQKEEAEEARKIAEAEAEKARLEAEAAEKARLETEAAEEARRKAEAEAAEAAKQEAEAKAKAAQEARLAAEADLAKAAEAERAAAQARAAEAAELARIEAEKAQAAELAAQVEAERLAEQKRKAEEAEQERLAEEARVAEAARKAAEQERLAEEARVAEEKARLAEQERLAVEQKQAAEAARLESEEAARIAKEQEEAEAALRDIEDARPEPQDVIQPMTTLAPSALDEVTEEPQEKKGLLGRLFNREKKTVVKRTLDDDMLEQLEELLITADMGVDTSLRVTANIAEGNMGRKLSVAEIKGLMSSEITRIMDGVARPMPLYAHKPQVVLVVGVNGSGKTTTIGKLASQFKAAGKSVVVAAGDTFRAAAVEQLQVWGERAGVPVLTAPEGSDPASLAFDAMEQAERDGADLLMIDTAGRLQNRADLMEELAKIVRVIRKKDPDAPHNTLLVLDATTGQNALNQVKVFQDLADVSGLVMTKLDGTAKGGVLVALADKFGLPIHAIGVGEQIDDLAPFDPEDFAKALVGLD